ncbi:DUF4148 domain-containing protein [Paraburkholderia sp. MMS20-SJTN17]|uniref:DUF4148 domain-containing protein n=1 Tax=Paraburkholderia translucens TaxID=2886945 RepID=A0ABS8K765_9BURK|nr:DUF4148 domain-containing protein [Paraburkholderia sp. MMS20-SJTN17]MCC8400586.1 DUF4148 domain-containing protein [Paraburkholderia sp. MMS20-SJTN17]
MKTTIIGIAGIGMLVAPVLSFAQTSNHPTRAEVRSELVQLEKAGYNPARRDDATYPRDIQSAEARVAANEPRADLSASGMGGSTSLTSQSGGGSTAHHNTSKLYAHH